MEESKDDLGDFLSEELLLFVNDKNDLLYTSSHAYQTSSCNNILSEDTDSLLLQAIKDLNGQASPKISTTARPFSDPVSRENIEQTIQNSIPRIDTKYCYSM